jgi:hypothetical protein
MPTAARIGLVFAAAVAGCSDGDRDRVHGPSPCIEESREPLETTTQASWPQGLAELLDAYGDSSGSWNLSVACDGNPEYDGPVQLTLTQCARADFELIELSGECDGAYWQARCTTASLLLEGWKGGAFDDGAASVLETDRHGDWTQWTTFASAGNATLAVTGFVAAPMMGRVDVPASPMTTCDLEAFERP